jgi:type VII secretion effector (TIGR04197 family)
VAEIKNSTLTVQTVSQNLQNANQALQTNYPDPGLNVQLSSMTNYIDKLTESASTLKDYQALLTQDITNLGSISAAFQEADNAAQAGFQQ